MDAWPPNRSLPFVALAAAVIPLACSPAPPRPADTADMAEELRVNADATFDEGDLEDMLAETTFHDSWDRDSDGMIDGEEFGYAFADLSARDSWVYGGRGKLTPADIQLAVARRSPVDMDAYRWDLDDDGVVEPEELAAGMHRAWDVNRDRRLDDPELARGLFVFWDANGDGRLDPDELPPSLRPGG